MCYRWFFVILLVVLSTDQCLGVDCEKFFPSEGATEINVWELRNLGLAELNECLSVIGAKPLDEELAKNIWGSLKSVKRISPIYKVANAVPRDCFKNMGYALIGISPEDFENITIGDIEMVEIFGQHRGFNPEQMYAILGRVQDDWTEKVPETYSQYDLEALKQILCVMNQSDIERIHPDAYKGAAQTIGSLQDCAPEVIQGFAKLAINSRAFGPPENWSKLDVATIGAVLSGLPPNLYKSIPSDNLAKKTDKVQDPMHHDMEMDDKTDTISDSM